VDPAEADETRYAVAGYREGEQVVVEAVQQQTPPLT